MKTLIAPYKTPTDADAFMTHYEPTHLPLVNKSPGV